MDINLDGMSVQEMTDLLDTLNDYEKYNKIEYFTPYTYQNTMFEAGSDNMTRFACLANRIGKTYAGGVEMALHLTGRYPTWWKGHRFDYPIKAWAIGITNDSTRKALQDVLMGTIDVRDEESIGTGAIPRQCIVMENMEKEGPAIKAVRVKHVSGGESLLEFRSTQQGVHTLTISVAK